MIEFKYIMRINDTTISTRFSSLIIDKKITYYDLSFRFPLYIIGFVILVVLLTHSILTNPTYRLKPTATFIKLWILFRTTIYTISQLGSRVMSWTSIWKVRAFCLTVKRNGNLWRFQPDSNRHRAPRQGVIITVRPWNRWRGMRDSNPRYRSESPVA